ncbi:MAG: Gfo/Idh/MocA family oxidoreductase [Roseiflexus sp.]|jgi:predicted dehydrogenase|nr:Gfo/Idh/MocA family oxidoreductase [Roseiflexus sp.]MBO9365384.1 Gfo/Idh/MocA family oxidoreductase [Roseiflexus sp.]MBO9381555.1 Gfo/Idh/MocA family oxidoreductase [Roseiflexus sp.]MBO9387660.1 Gfo/Idh/MocA family oxidoreductase [Roseiflexus sp.]
MPEIAAAVVGTGFIGVVHVEALRRLGIPVLGVVGSSVERARAKADAMGIPVYASFEDMLADPRVTVVHITTPNYLHFPQVKAAIAAGKHVVCEKPLAMTSAESAELLRLATEAGIVHAVNFNIRFYPLCQHARALVQAGEIGAPRIIQGSYLQDWLMLPTDWNWRLEPELGGELRAVADIGSHWLDLTTFITGEKVSAVMADLATFIPVRRKPTRPIDTFIGKEVTVTETIDQPIHTEDYASILLRFASGARGVLTVSQVSLGRKNRLSFEIDGERSALAWDSERPEELWLGRRETASGLLLRDPALLLPAARSTTDYPGGHAEGFPDTFKQLYKAVYRAVAAGAPLATPDYPTFADGHEELLLGEAILRSAREERWVAIER